MESSTTMTVLLSVILIRICFGGLTANLSYKQFSLFANFGYQIGGLKIYNKTLQNLPGQLTGLIDYGLNDRWSDTNKDAKYPALYIGDGVPRLTDHELFDVLLLPFAGSASDL